MSAATGLSSTATGLAPAADIADPAKPSFAVSGRGNRPPPDDAPLEARLRRIMIDRLGHGAIPIAIAQVLSTVLNLSQSHYLTSMSSALSCLAWIAVAVLTRRGAIDERWAGLLTCFLWLQIHVGTLTSYFEMSPSVPSLWLAITMIGYACVQLERRYFWGPIGAATLLWVGVLFARGVPDASMHVVSVASAVVLALLAFRSNHVLISHLEQLKGAEYRRSIELAEALALAEHELNERRLAERERERLREQFIQSQRLEAIGSLAGGVAHDMNNVLTSISTVTGLIAKVSDERLASDIAVIQEACERGATLTGSLLGFSRRAQYRKARFELNAAVDDAMRLLGRTLPKNIELHREPAEASPWVEADRSHLVQVIVNLCINSERAIEGQGRIRVGAGERVIDAREAVEFDLDEGRYACLTVSDNGCGMSAEVRRRAFEPFFTTKQVGEGSGLGLAMVYGTVRAHAGGVSIESWPGRGTRVTCLLPLTQPPECAAEPAARLAQPSRPARESRVLVVDDERLVRYSTARALAEQGYAVLTAEDGQDALDVFNAESRRIDVVVLDMSMPRMNGAECYRRLRELAPALPIICVSGYPLDSAAGQLMGRELHTLQKPFRMDELQALIRRVLEPQASARAAD